MKLSEICIKRPVLATVLSLVLIIFGIMGFNLVNTSFYPKFESLQLIVSTVYTGASAQLIESSITTPLEEAIAGTEGIDTMESSSVRDESTITLTLKFGVDLNETANKVRNAVNMARAKLPSGIDPPLVNTGWGDMALMYLGFSAKHQDPEALRDYLDRYIVNQIEQIPGVSTVNIIGANRYAMRVWLDPQKMAAYSIGVDDITNAIRSNNVELPAGSIKGTVLNFPITAETKLKDAKAFADISLTYSNNQAIYLRDVADVKLGTDNSGESLTNINGDPGLGMQIFSATEANPILVAQAIHRLLKQIEPQLPAGMKIVPSFDQSTFMNASVHEVYVALIIAVLCVVLVIFLFLGRLRSALIPIATLPICILSTFGLIYILGFTINMITLLAIVMSIGLVVDDAIVMLENIYRHIEAGMKPFAAAIQGSREIAFPVISMTLTLAAVYAPVGLVRGPTAHILQSFSFTLAGAVIISGFVSLTLSPMMCAYLLKGHALSPNPPAPLPGSPASGRGKYENLLEHFFKKLHKQYKKLLKHALSRRGLIILVFIVLFIAGFYLLKTLPKSFTPNEDMGIIVGNIITPSSASLDYRQKKVEQVTQIIQQFPEVESVMSFSNESNNGMNTVFALLKDFKNRHRRAEQLSTDMNQKIKEVLGLNAYTYSPSFGDSMEYALQFTLMSSGTYQDLYHQANSLIESLKENKNLSNLRTDMLFDSQQYALTVNRDLANSLHVNVLTIDTTLANLLGGMNVSTYTMGNKDYDVFMQANDRYLHNIDAIKQIHVKNIMGQLVPIGNLVSIQSILAQPSLPHYNRQRSANIYAQLEPGYPLGLAVDYLNQQLPKFLTGDTRFSFTGSAKKIMETSSDMGLLFILALVFIYLVLAAQFESFIDPLVILLTVPLSVVGALFSLKCLGGSINIYTGVGLVTLIGLITKHGILITEFSNQQRLLGLSIREALIKASIVRLRPILMTTAATIFGALPLALATGASSVSRQEIGIVIVGGMFFGTFFSLIVVPVAYSFAAKLKKVPNQSSVKTN